MLLEKESIRADKLRKIADKMARTVMERTDILKNMKEQVSED
jgi:hypothetical protein